MIESVPLIQNANDAQQINASIIAMKKASKELDEKILKLNNLNKELDKKIAVLDSGLTQEITDRENADSAEVTNRNTAITNAVNSLDVASVGGSGKYISAISETDGKINATVSDLTSVIESGNNQPATSGGVADAIDKINYSVNARNIDTLYPSKNRKSEVFGGNFSGNVPEPILTAILKTFRVSSINTSEVQIYQEWEAYGTSASSYAPNQYFRFGYFTGSASPTWTAWQKVIRNSDAMQYLGWSTYYGSSLGEAVLSAMNSLPILYNKHTEAFCFRGTWSGHGYFQAYIATPRTIQNYVFNVMVQYSKATSVTNKDTNLYLLEVNYNTNNTPVFTLLSEKKFIRDTDVVDSLTMNEMNPVTSNAVRKGAVRIFGQAFSNLFTVNTTVSVVDFVNAVVDMYGEGAIELVFNWVNATQGYITDGTTNILINGNFLRGYFQYFKDGYNWRRSQLLTYDINTQKTYMIEISKGSEAITTHIYPLN